MLLRLLDASQLYLPESAICPLIAGYIIVPHKLTSRKDLLYMVESMPHR
jgi:hypothetical protein